MIEIRIRVGSRQRVFIPDVHAFDEHSGEPQDPVAANLPVLFAVVPAGAAEPDNTAYVAGSWAVGASSPTAMILVGPGGGALTPAAGVYDLWMGVNGTAEAPRAVVARLTID